MTALRALLVEDSEDDALLVVRALTNYGLEIEYHRVASEKTLREAIAEGDWDLAILDHNLPGFGGFQALRILQEHDFGGPMITVSGTIGEQTAVEVMRSGAHDYVMKDNLTRLGPAVERELREAQVRRERHRARAALKASEERYRTLVETMGDGITMVDGDGRITYANEAFAEMVGYDINELIGVRVQQVYAPESMDQLHCQLTERFEDGVSAEYEATLLSRSGEQIPILTHATPLREDDGHITGSLAVIKDMTERKRAEENVRESQERLRAVFDASPDGIVAIDVEGYITDCNLSVAQALGLESCQQLIGKRALQFVAEEHREQAHENLVHVLHEGRVSFLHYDMVRPDGSTFPVEASANAIMGDDGEPAGIVATLKDITERLEAERELQQLNQFRRSIIDQANIWLHVLDRDLNAVLWNPAAAEISGIPEEEALDGHRTWEVMYPDPDTRDEMLGIATQIIEDGRMLEDYDTTIETQDGQKRIISWNARQLVGPDGEPIGLLAMGRNVTEHQQLEQQLRQAVKMEAIGRLAGGIAHDFNNMLTAILGNVQLIGMQLESDSDLHRLLDEVRIAARRSADLTRQLLAFSRKQAMEPETLDLNRLIERIEPMLERMIGEHISVLTNLDPDLGLIAADPSQVDQVLMNLVVNARDAMPDGGTLTIETADTCLDGNYAEMHADVEPGCYVMLSVSDTGVGMDEATREHIFEPFFTTKGEEEGTGLGLATVYGIVSQSGGHIYVYSEPDEGSVFKVYFPRAAGDESDVEADGELTDEDLTGRETVLLVEDEDIVRGLMGSVLTRHGHTVLTAENAEEAVEIAAACEGRIDIMVTDVVMPGMNGAELAEVIHQHRPGMPVLFVSGYTDNSVIRQGVVERGAHYLQKPFDPEKLLRRIRQVLDESR